MLLQQHAATWLQQSEFKNDLNSSHFTKRQLFSLQKADPTAAPHQPIEIYPFNIILTRFSENRFDKIS
jgi:hypothetical protein